LKPNTKIITMKFAAALLAATASASYSAYPQQQYQQYAPYHAQPYAAQPYHEEKSCDYEEPKYEEPKYEEPKYEEEPQYVNWTKSYATQYKKIDVDAIVTELNRRNEQRVRAVRDETFATVRGLTEDTRAQVDELIGAFEADILALREAIQMSRDNKRAEMNASNSAIRATQDQILADLAFELETLNVNQETLLAEILLADMYYDHTRIAKLLDNDGKAAALTWEEPEVRTPVETVADSYLSWNARQPAERVYNELYTANQYQPQYQSHGYGYQQPHYGY